MRTHLLVFIVASVMLSGCIKPLHANTTTTLGETTIPPTTTLECTLSLCDCKCHPKGETREETDGVLCGINCLGEYGIEGCGLKNGECTELVSKGKTTTTVTAGLSNPASVKCIEDGGRLEMDPHAGGQRGICLFPDGSVCDEWAYFRGECMKGGCMKKCGAVGSRSEGWYDCNGELLYWDKCSETAAGHGL